MLTDESSRVARSGPQVTLVCPLKDRPEHFRRLLIALSLSGRQHPVLFLDGSTSEACELVWRDFLSHTNSDKLKFVRSKPDVDWQQFLSKVVSGLKSVETEFVHLTCDDDFSDQDNLESACMEMRNDSTISIVIGNVIDFEVKGEKSSAHRDVYGNLVLEPRHLACSGRYLQSRHVDDEHLEDRLEQQRHVWPYEGVWRTQDLITAFSMALKAGVTSYRSLLPILRTVCLVLGKVHFSDAVFVLRQDNTRDSDGAQMLASFPTRLDFFLSDATANERRSVTAELAAFAGNGAVDCSRSIAAASWQYHYILEEYMQARDREVADDTVDDGGMRWSLSALSPARRLFGLGRRLLPSFPTSSARVVETRGIAASFPSWYPGEKAHLLAAVSAVQSFGDFRRAQHFFDSHLPTCASHQNPSSGDVP